MSIEFVALDVETANAFRSSICQVGLVLVREDRVAGRWQTLVQPPPGRDYFESGHIAVHGITAADVAGAAHFIETWPEIERRLHGYPVIAHNASFDIAAVREATAYCGLDGPDLRIACSLVLSRKRYPELAAHTLDACCAAAGVPLERHHEALTDATACAELILDMARRVGAESLDELLAASGVAWGRLSKDSYEPCVSTGPDIGVAVATLC